MKSDVVKEFVAMIEADAQSRPSSAEFEMAYQARVAMDRIRFAIKATQTGTLPESLKEAAMQLTDALDRLEAAERKFQDRWRSPKFKPGDAGLPSVQKTNGNGRIAL